MQGINLIGLIKAILLNNLSPEQLDTTKDMYTGRHYRTASFTRHNVVIIQFIYMKFSGNVGDGMLSLYIWKPSR